MPNKDPLPNPCAPGEQTEVLFQGLSIEVLKKFRLIFGSVRQHFHAVEETCGISGSQLWVLQEVAKVPGIGVSAVAERLSIHQSTCSQLVEKLVGRGYLVKARAQDDQRRVGLTASVSGQAVLSEAPGPATGVLPDALNALDMRTLLTLDAALEQVIRKLPTRDMSFSSKPLADL